MEGRLLELRKERTAAMRETATAGGGTALVVTQQKLALRDEALGQWKTKSTRPNLRNAGYREGVAAGDRAQFSRPVNGSGSRLAIGAR